MRFAAPFALDLINAAAAELGLATEFRESPFNQIIPAVDSGNTNVAVAAMTDTKERERAADWITYYSDHVLLRGNPLAPASRPPNRPERRLRSTSRRAGHHHSRHR